jgi:hypothetical protein
MDDGRLHDIGFVLIISPRHRVRAGIRALLEAAGIAVGETAALAAGTAPAADVAALVLDLTDGVGVPPALTRPGGPPSVGVVQGPVSAEQRRHVASVVQIDDGPDAIIDAVRLAAARRPR